MREFLDGALGVSPEVRRLTDIVQGQAFQKLEADFKARETAQTESRRSAAVSDIEAADAWYLAEEPQACDAIKDAAVRLKDADRALEQAKRDMIAARQKLVLLRLERDRRKMLARRELHRTVPQAIADFEDWLREDTEETHKKLRTWKEPTGFLSCMTGQAKTVERSNCEQVAERLEKIREARDWCTRYRESAYLTPNDLYGELEEWRREIQRVWIR